MIRKLIYVRYTNDLNGPEERAAGAWRATIAASLQRENTIDELLTLQHFEDKVGQMFDAMVHGGAVEITLVSAEALPLARGPELSRPPFSLLFLGPAEEFLGQGIQQLSHPELGTREIFLVPIGRDADGAYRYQAVFN